MAKAKEIEGLDCGAEALEGIRLVLRTRFGEMYDQRAAALDREDPRGVHDMRVASRRLRSALRDFKDFLDGKGFPKRRLKKVARSLGEVRDLDVAIAALREMRSKADGEVAAGIERLLRERSMQRERARQGLVAFITETKLAELRLKFLARLESVRGMRGTGDASGTRGAAKALSFRQAGREIIESRLAELRDLSDSLHHPFEIEPLHRLRIAAKRLRYALELYSPCWGGELSPFAKEVAELQGALGDLRDCDVWIADLGERLDRQRDERAVEQSAASQLREAAIWLLDHFTKEYGRHFRSALARWHGWEIDGFFGRLTALLEDSRTNAPAAKAHSSRSDAPPHVTRNQ